MYEGNADPEQIEPIEQPTSPYTRIFGGKLDAAKAIEELRVQLLDLTTKNRLLNYKYPKGRSIQIIGDPHLVHVYDRLWHEAQPIRLLDIPDPPLDSYQGRKPDVRGSAEGLGISTSHDFAQKPEAYTSRRLPGLQVLQYPTEAERLIRKVANEAKTAIEETGSNMLFLIFGFLEFYETDESDKAMLAPLISVPITFKKGEPDKETLIRQWWIQSNGEDVTDNATLKEKLKQFAINLPELNHEDGPERYFALVEEAIKTRRRWKVRRQLTIGMLSFDKLAIWADLDTVKNPALPLHPGIKGIFESAESKEAADFHAPDYKIDELPDGDIPLIYDADSSQHSAIIDALGGKSIVIHGPPGTGKSQTITNLIAASLSRGKTVLFVSEKLTALEVVRKRLTQANLGHFCLELHSRKTNKKLLLNDIAERINARFERPTQFDGRIATLRRHKQELARHVELMASKVGNQLGLTVQEIFWACERRRMALGDLANLGIRIDLDTASTWTRDNIQQRREMVDGMARAWANMLDQGTPHPFHGFDPRPFVPGDDDAIRSVLAAARGHLVAFAGHADELREIVDESDPLVASEVNAHLTILREIPEPPEEFLPGLLPTLFNRADPRGHESKKALIRMTAQITQARQDRSEAAEILRCENAPNFERAATLRREAAAMFPGKTLSMPLSELAVAAKKLAGQIEAFESAMAAGNFRWSRMQPDAATTLTAAIDRISDLNTSNVAFGTLASTAAAVSETCSRLRSAQGVLKEIGRRRSLEIDDRPVALASLLEPNGIEGLNAAYPEQQDIDAAKSFLAAGGLPTNASVAAITLVTESIGKLESRITESLDRCLEAADRLNLKCDGPRSPEEELRAVLTIARRAPFELLRFRTTALADRGATELIGKLRLAIEREANLRWDIEDRFHMESVPEAAELKTALAVFRAGDGFFKSMGGEWRRARKLFDDICKERKKRSAVGMAEDVTKLLAWREHCDSFKGHAAWSLAFGGLYDGLSTELDKLERLQSWHAESHALLLTSGNMFGRLDLVTVDSTYLESVAARADRIEADLTELENCEATLSQLLGFLPEEFRSARRRGWPDALKAIGQTRANLTAAVAFFRRQGSEDLTPVRIVELMEARGDLTKATPEITCLIGALDDLRRVGGSVFASVLANKNPSCAELIEKVGQSAARLSEVIHLLANHADENASLEAILVYLDARTKLQSTMASIAALPNFVKQDEFLERSRSACALASDIAQIFDGAVSDETTVEDAFVSVRQLASAEETMADVASNQTYWRLFGPAMAGYDTDCEAIAKTHAWGVAVTNPIGLRQDVRLALLSADAADVLAKTRSIYAQMADSLEASSDALEKLGDFGGIDLAAWYGTKPTPTDLLEKIDRAMASSEGVLTLSRWRSLERSCRSEGLAPFVDMVERNEVPVDAAGAVFELSAYMSIGKKICREIPEVAKFEGKTHTRIREEFQALDKQIISLTGQMCAHEIDSRKVVPQGTRGAAKSDWTEMFLLQNELGKVKRHAPIRQILARAGKALRALKPCFMMGPLAVAQYLRPGQFEFDIVVMDEASQLLPEDALGAIARGKQVVVVGDPKQLPPTNFFGSDRSDDDDDDEDATVAIKGVESILGICQQIYSPTRSLRWHYRSQHESLIAFSNHHFYKNLVVFPSPHADDPGLGVKSRFVADGVYEDRRNLPEAKRIAEAAIWHMKTRPLESLGVVTLNTTQRDLVEELIESRLRSEDGCKAYREFWEEEGHEFFVMNLEAVQGHERDCIMISTTFGKPKGVGKVRQNFGPISRPDGWRRLNVLFTRAKRRVELFTSMMPEDIVDGPMTPQGTRILRYYLEYARSGNLGSVEHTERDPDSDFEVAVANAVRAHGYDVCPQLGVAGFFIDMAVRNPDRPGEWLAAIECDGASYHSGLSVRDRDRIRQEILEGLGWKGRIHRIWSTDWFYRPAAEMAKLIDFLNARRAESQQRANGEFPRAPWEGDDFTFADKAAGSPETATVISDEDVAVAEALADIETSSSSDLYVEVGDRVTYCFAESPGVKFTVKIVTGASDPERGLVNEDTALAQALLGLAEGENNLFTPPNAQRSRTVLVVRIER